jgi:hypothetical protein
MRYLSPAVPQGGTKDGWSLPAILIRFLKVKIFNIGCPGEMKVSMSEIEFALSSSGLMQNEDSSTLPEQDEDRGGWRIICNCSGKDILYICRFLKKG